ncbi:hypothetical protein BJV78DRAFT_1158349 [Lactifluus subvellereus]|nr:hypothetical protein BJV78DRAFT_1158349 [Lactifluus subvellereus]
MSDAQKQLLLHEIHKLFNDAISYNLYTGLAYGMLLAVYFISIRILLYACFSFAKTLQALIALSSSKGSLFNSPGHMFMFGSTTLIFVLATIVIAVGTGLTSQGIPIIIKLIDPSFVIGWSPHKIDVVVGIVATIYRLNACPVLGDVVCAWRAIALWKYDRRVVTILSACVLGTFAACIYDLKLALKSRPGTQGEQNLEQGKVAMIVVGPMLGTNILSTLLIAWKAWCAADIVYVPKNSDDSTLRELRRIMGAHLKKGSPSERMENVLALLIESGFLYCLLWVTVFSTTLSSPLNRHVPLDILLVHCIQPTARFGLSMYPATIIIIVCMQIGQDAYTTKPERSAALDLTTIRFPVGDSTVNSAMPTTVSDGGKSLSTLPSPGW